MQTELSVDGDTYSEFATIALHLASGKESVKGTTAVSRAAVIQWLNVCACAYTANPTDILASLDAQLSDTSYVAGHRFTVADVAVYHAVATLLKAAAVAPSPSTARWLDQVAHEPGFAVLTSAHAPPAPTLAVRPALALPAAAAGNVVASAPAAADDKKAEKAAKKEKAAKAAPAPAAAPAPEPEAVALCEFKASSSRTFNAWP